MFNGKTPLEVESIRLPVEKIGFIRVPRTPSVFFVKKKKPSNF